MSRGKAEQAPPTAAEEERSRAAGRAAGYCWARNPNGPGRCTLRPHSEGDHVDVYNGRKSPTDVKGYRWPQR